MLACGILLAVYFVHTKFQETQSDVANSNAYYVLKKYTFPETNLFTIRLDNWGLLYSKFIFPNCLSNEYIENSLVISFTYYFRIRNKEHQKPNPLLPLWYYISC